MDKLLKDNPAHKKEYETADDEGQAEIGVKLRSEECYKRDLISALNDPAQKKEYKALPAEEQHRVGAALVAKFRHQAALLGVAKRAPGACKYRGVTANRGKWKALIKPEGKKRIYLGGTFTTVRATPPCPPLRPAHCIPTLPQTALHLRTELHCCGAANAQRRRRRRRRRTTRQRAVLDGRMSFAISSSPPCCPTLPPLVPQPPL
jgi:hypothetical protein